MDIKEFESDMSFIAKEFNEAKVEIFPIANGLLPSFKKYMDTLMKSEIQKDIDRMNSLFKKYKLNGFIERYIKQKQQIVFSRVYSPEDVIKYLRSLIEK